MPVFALDFESTEDNSSRTNYSRETQQTQTVQPVKKQSAFREVPVTQTTAPVQKTTPAVQVSQPTPQAQPVQTAPKPAVIRNILPTVPALPEKAYSTTVAPNNTQYSGKVPNSEALIPCNVKVNDLVINNSVVKSKTASLSNNKNQVKKYRTATLASGTQFRVVNQTKITDYMYEGQTIVFRSTQELSTPYFKIPINTKFTGRVVDAHKPQMSCNGGLVAFRIISAEINGYNQPINAGIIRMNNERVHFSNLKGDHTYWKTTCKKAKWGQNIFAKWSRTSDKLAATGPGVVLAPFPYVAGFVIATASTVTSPITALLGKGGRLVVQPNTTFTIKLYDDAQIRY